MTNLHFQHIAVATTAYEKMIDLRMQVLLSPIGIPRNYINPEKEAEDILLGAFWGEELVACCILTRHSAQLVQLRQMAVATALQKKGAGAALLSFAENVARQNGYQTLMMHARDAVIPFYEKCGYRITGNPFVEVGIGHHRMEKELQ